MPENKDLTTTIDIAEIASCRMEMRNIHSNMKKRKGIFTLK